MPTPTPTPTHIRPLSSNVSTNTFLPLRHSYRAQSACEEGTASHHLTCTPFLALAIPPQRCHVAQISSSNTPKFHPTKTPQSCRPTTSVEDTPSILDSALPTLLSYNYYCLFHTVFHIRPMPPSGVAVSDQTWTRLSSPPRPMRSHQVTLPPYLIRPHLPRCHSFPRATPPDQLAPAPRSNLRPFPENLWMA